ncbi:alkaline ceramidase 3-like isoform X2 [Apostichopus japonicus]|uniref:alkaline ceramidase 3-like isoform X2 n=1 Tax=Stichopus japonicus TaxID=307972 RepID=UPI003AB72FF0
MAPIDGDKEGYWGKPTATLDWCEENYAVTPYIAEFWNTVSNLVFFTFPIITACFFVRDRVEKRFLLSCLGFLTVGVGSWCFHMTLRYEMQLLDELPMIWGSCLFLYCIFECHSKRDHHNKGLIALLLFVCAGVTGIYITFKNPYLFQAAYGTLVIVMIVRGFYLSCWKCVEYSKYLFIYAVATYASGFILWNIDNHFCPQIRSLRQSLPFPLAVFTQLHAWWHVLAAIGTHAHVILGCHYRQVVLGNKSTVWHSLGVLPFVKVDEVKTVKKHENGYHSNNVQFSDQNKNHYD